MTELWLRLPADAQDALILLALLAAPLALGWALSRGLALGPLLRGLMRRYLWTNLIFVGLVAAAVAVGVALLAQERALRRASAQVADKFDVIVAAPGDEVSMLLAAVYLQPSAAPLLDGAAFARIAADPAARLAAPLAFGDSYRGAPVVGSTAGFVTHLSGALAEGRLWRGVDEVVIGAKSALTLGDSFSPAHGHDALAEAEAHAGVRLRVVGRMASTGSPWDRAIIAPVESVWRTHGLAEGHAPGADHLGPPFDPDYFPGTPAVIVTIDSLVAAYRLRAAFSTERSMAFFPGAVLARLHGLMGDARAAMSVLALATQALVAAAVVAGLAVLTRLFARNLALLRALGAPRRMVFALIWRHAATLLGAGGALGLGLGWLGARALSAVISARTDLALSPGLGWAELHLAAAFLGAASLIALAPAALALGRPVTADLRR